MSDLIERQRVIDALNGLCDRECEYSKKQRHVMCDACHLGSAFDVIEQLPTQTNTPNTLGTLDCVSRQAAIDVAENAFVRGLLASPDIRKLPSAQPERAMKDCRNCKHGNYNDHWGTYFCYHSGDCNDWDKWEPSAQPEPQWIPVSERLPEDGEECLVSIRYPNEFVLIDRATYSTNLFTVDKEDFFGNRGEAGWYYYDREYGYCNVLNVIAWMPLPEPYRAERRTDESD